MSTVKKYFRVVIREPLKIPLSLEDHRQCPTIYLKVEEYKERIVEVEYSLPKITDPESFDKLIRKVIKGNYSHVHTIIEFIKPEEKQIEQ